MISIRFLWDVYWEKGGDRVRGCMSVRVGERDLFQRRLWEGGRVFCVIHKSIITKRNVKRDVCRSDEILFYKLMRMIPKFILVYIWFNAKFLNKNFKFWVLFFFLLCLVCFLKPRIHSIFLFSYKVGRNGGARRRSGNPGWDCRRKGKIYFVLTFGKSHSVLVSYYLSAS